MALVGWPWTMAVINESERHCSNWNHSEEEGRAESMLGVIQDCLPALTGETLEEKAV